MASEWRKAFDTPAYDTLEDWIAEEVKGGQKFVTVTFICGCSMVAQIRWNDGSVQDVRTGKRADGKVCVLAVRPVAPPPT